MKLNDLKDQSIKGFSDVGENLKQFREFLYKLGNMEDKWKGRLDEAVAIMSNQLADKEETKRTFKMIEKRLNNMANSKSPTLLNTVDYNAH